MTEDGLGRTLVIGATGFVGRAVLRELTRRGERAVGMRRWNSNERIFERLDVPDVVGDLQNYEDVLHAVSGVNRVVYSAAPEPGLEEDEYRGRATTAIRHVLEAAREAEVESVVVTSTAATVGSPSAEEPATEKEVYLPGRAEDHFVEAAYAVEQECFREAADGQSIVILNPTLIVGSGARFPAYRQLDAESDHRVDVADRGRVARAHAGALQHGRRGERYLVSGERIRLGDLYERLESRGDIEVADGWPWSSSHTPHRNRYLLEIDCWYDDAKARRTFDLDS